jgi:hypothetical protein
MNTKPRCAAASLGLVALFALAGPARAQSAAASVADKASGVAVKVEKAIERGVKAAASGVERGMTAAGGGVQRGAQVAASGVERGVKAAASGVERGARAASDAAGTVARKVGAPPAAASTPAATK